MVKNAMKENREIIPLRTILQNCLNHIENLESNRSICDNYEKEFQDLKQFSETLKSHKEFACTEGEKEVNRKKNRYKDILPFNVSRVILSKYAGIPGSDYINANFIKGASGSPAYIASQGPLPNTVNDFWRMVVECEVQVIVMACNAEEAGKHKCENYWVEKEGEEKRFGMVEICLVKASTVCPDFLVRTMRLKYTNDKSVKEERTICQFHYSAWPDHGVPPLVRPLLDMVRLVRDTQASETLPVLVHCSAGCGRTGTICAIDFVWGLLRAGKLTEEFSLFNLVKDMRKQRVAMVQTKEQYILVHQAVRELFKEQLRVIESHPYENIDVNGIPLIKDFEEPLYDTIGPCDSNCDEKQDENKMEKSESEKKENFCNSSNKNETAPPLPRKKRPNIPFSKHEKEVENLTEKNRCSNIEKEKEVLDVSPSNSLLSKPRIAKLKALFERSPTNRERNSAKQRGTQTVSRSHSLGAIRKPLFSEVFDSHSEKNKSNPSLQPIPDGGKLKVPKLSISTTTVTSKPVPIIKRSKSLKSVSQQQKLTTLVGKPAPTSDSTRDNLNKSRNVNKMSAKNSVNSVKRETISKGSFKKSITTQDLQKTQYPHELYKRRRSLESLIGDEPPLITWPATVMFPSSNLSVSSTKTRNSKISSEVILSPSKQSFKNVQGVKEFNAESLKYHFQNLTIEAQKKMSTLASGIGIRERRNSFRQAISKDHVQSGHQNHMYEYIWIDPKRGKEKLESKTIQVHPYPKNFNEKLTVRNQNGEILHPVPPVDIPDGVCLRKEENSLHSPQNTSKVEANSQIRIELNGSHNKPSPIQRAKTHIMKLNNEFIHSKYTQRPHELVRTLSSHAIQDKNSAFSVVRLEDESRSGVESKNLFLHRLNIEIQEGKNLRRQPTKEDKLDVNNIRMGLPERKGIETISITSGTKFAEKGTGQEPLQAHRWKELNIRMNVNEQEEKEASWNYKTVCPGDKSGKSSAVSNTCNPNFLGIHSFGKNIESQKLFKEPQTSKDARKTVHRTLSCTPKSLDTQVSVVESCVKRVIEAPVKDSSVDHDRKLHRTWKPSGQGEEAELKSQNSQHYPKNLDPYPPGNSQSSSTYAKKAVPKSGNRNPQIIEVRKKSLFPSSANSLSSHSSGDMSHSDQHSQKSDSPRILESHDVEGIAKPEIIRLKPNHFKIPDKKSCMDDENKHEYGSESSGSSSARELASVLPPKPLEEVYNYGIVASVKFRPSKPYHSRDDFILGEPVAPPRVKRHASVKIPRQGGTEPSFHHLSAWPSPEKKSFETNNWNEAFGVDLDAVAASIQRQKGESSGLSETTLTNKTQNTSTSSQYHFKKQQHYL